jgi:hypothetical protein
MKFKFKPPTHCEKCGELIVKRGDIYCASCCREMIKKKHCLNPKCRRRKVLCWVTSANVLGQHPTNVPIHSLEDYKNFIATDGRKREPFPTDKEFKKV